MSGTLDTDVTQKEGAEPSKLPVPKSPTPKKLTSDLLKKLKSYDPDFDKVYVKKAIDYAIEHHGDQKRHSGEPYYNHPIAVADILADMKLDTLTIVTALLHDVVEDTDISLDDIKEEFGEDVSVLVDGVTKLTKIEFQSEDHRQAENFRKLLIAVSEDIRVLLVKLADRLHNMRTLQYIDDSEKRKRKAHETMEVFAPLAERIGMQNLKDELQDISFQELNEDAYKSVANRLQYLRESDAEMVERTVKHFKKLLSDNKIKAEVSGREKTAYSIWKKMQRKNISFEQLSDIIAFRIVVDSKMECYQALGVIHDSYHMIPKNFKDYISTAKSNGYQSLHTVVIGPEQKRIEIQIRTDEMHEIAELGVAAHWSYKQGEPYDTDGRQYRWVRELLHIIENAMEPEDMMEHTRLAFYNDQVFCFTPRGDIIALPQGATPVDFAFSVHSAVGRTCVGAKVNGRIVPLRTKLSNGDQVEIIQSKSQKPSPAWQHFVVTGKAKSEVKRFIKNQKRDEYVRLGRQMLEKTFLSYREELHDKDIKSIIKQFKKNNIDDIFAAVGEGTMTRHEVVKALFPDKIVEKKKPTIFSMITGKKEEPKDKDKLSVPIVGLIPGMAIHFAGCCHPLPGEQITGIVNSGKGITIHAIDCGELESFVESPERWIDVGWEKDMSDGVYVGRLSMVLSHQKGVLGNIANAIAQADGNINNLRILNKASDFYEIIMDIEVQDLEHLNDIMAMLRSKSSVHTVTRYKEGK